MTYCKLLCSSLRDRVRTIEGAAERASWSFIDLQTSLVREI